MMPITPSYQIRRTSDASPHLAAWDSDVWSRADEATIANFHPAGSDHRPEVQVRMLYDTANLYLRYRVTDRFVVARHQGYQAPVWRDSCVECFVQPRTHGPSETCGYFNFEINCGGSLLLYYIEDPKRTPEGFVRYTRVAEGLAAQIEIQHSLPEQIEPEIDETTIWEIACRVPLLVVENYVGPLGELAGQQWRGNFYKCADDSSHPHWASWSPIGEELNFHQPNCFGTFRFAKEWEKL